MHVHLWRGDITQVWCNHTMQQLHMSYIMANMPWWSIWQHSKHWECYGSVYRSMELSMRNARNAYLHCTYNNCKGWLFGNFQELKQWIQVGRRVIWSLDTSMATWWGRAQFTTKVSKRAWERCMNSCTPLYWEMAHMISVVSPTILNMTNVTFGMKTWTWSFITFGHIETDFGNFGDGIGYSVSCASHVNDWCSKL